MDDTAKMLSSDGTHITTIQFDGFKISLYTIDGEFYEVFRDSADTIVKVAHATTEDLEKYLHRIEVKKFFSR